MSPRKSSEDTSLVASPEGDVVEPKASVVSVGADQIQAMHDIRRFRGRPMVLERWPFPHYVPMHKDRFEGIVYPILGGIPRSRVNDIFAYISAVATDLTDYENLILFGLEEPQEDGYYHADARTRVWDMDTLDWVDLDRYPEAAQQAVWRSPYGVIDTTEPVPFIMSLAGGSQDKYDDIMQSLAPLVMNTKPDGVIWWVGDGANGKSTLMDALYKIFPGQLSSITVKRLVDGRDTPGLNGTLANIVKESSEGRIEDTEIYKAVGTHENFRVHRFHSQDDMEIRGNVHHIFSANSVPTFNDKGYSARRRTFIVPFSERFESDPEFEHRTFTPLMFGQLIAEMCKYAVRLRDQNYKYKWSAATLSAKTEYDTEANNAEEYANHIIREGVVAFDSFNPVKMDYENWCADEGYVPLGITNLRRALSTLGFERLSTRTGDYVKKLYRLPVVSHPGELQALGMGRPGMYTVAGFQPAPEKVEVPKSFHEPVEPDEPEDDDTVEEEQPVSILNGKW